MTLLLDLVQFMDWTGDYRGVISTGESRAFVEAFDAKELVDHRGRYMSFARFRADYHSLVGAGVDSASIRFLLRLLSDIASSRMPSPKTTIGRTSTQSPTSGFGLGLPSD